MKKANKKKKKTQEPVQKKKKASKVTKKNAAKVAAAVGIIGLGAALYKKRDKIKSAVGRFLSKIKQTA